MPGDSTTGVNPGTRRYRCRSGEIDVAVTNAEQWHALAVCVGRPELAYEGAWSAVRSAPDDGGVAAVLGEMFSEDDAETWRKRLDAHGVPCRVV